MSKEKIELLHTKNHDLKNHLMSIRGYLHILSKKLKDSPDLLTFVQKVDSKIEKIADLSNEMVEVVDPKKTPSK